MIIGVSPHGQGRETTFAQIVAKELGVGIDRVKVHGDTGKVHGDLGTYGSRDTTVDGSAMMLAIQTIQEKLVKIAAHLWEASRSTSNFANAKSASGAILENAWHQGRRRCRNDRRDAGGRRADRTFKKVRRIVFEVAARPFSDLIPSGDPKARLFFKKGSTTRRPRAGDEDVSKTAGILDHA